MNCNQFTSSRRPTRIEDVLYLCHTPYHISPHKLANANNNQIHGILDYECFMMMAECSLSSYQNNEKNATKQSASCRCYCGHSATHTHTLLKMKRLAVRNYCKFCDRIVTYILTRGFDSIVFVLRRVDTIRDANWMITSISVLMPYTLCTNISSHLQENTVDALALTLIKHAITCQRTHQMP